MRLSGYDAWLERPYTEAAEAEARIEKEAEALNLTEAEAAAFDWDAHFAAQDEARYAEYAEGLEDEDEVAEIMARPETVPAGSTRHLLSWDNGKGR